VVDFSIALPQLLSGKNTALYTQLFTAYALTRSSRNAAVRGFLSGPRVQELLLRVGSGLRSECNVNWSGPLKIAFYRKDRNETKRNESKPTPFDSTQILSKRNPSNRKESNRNRLLSIRHYRRNPWVDSITFDSFRFDRLASIDSAISDCESLDEQ